MKNLIEELRKLTLPELNEVFKELGFKFKVNPDEESPKLDTREAFEMSGHLYVLHSGGVIESTSTVNKGFAFESFLQGNTFKTYEAAEKEKEQRIIATELRELAGDQSWIDWKDHTQYKYFIAGVSYQDEKIKLRSNMFVLNKISCIGNVYFKTPEARREAIDIVGEQRIIEAFK